MNYSGTDSIVFNYLERLRNGKLNEGTDYKILSCKKDSIVVLITDSENNREYVLKSNSPSYFFNSKQLEGIINSGNVESNPSTILGPSHRYPVQINDHEFWKEKEILKYSNGLKESENFTAKLLFVFNELNNKNKSYVRPRSVVTSKICHPTFRECFEKVPQNDSSELLKLENEYVDVLVNFHGILGRNFKDLYSAIAIGRRRTPGLKPRPRDEEYSRLYHYIRTIIYGASEDFSNSLKGSSLFKKLKNEDPLTRRRMIYSFMDQYVGNKLKISLSDVVKELSNKDRKIIYGQEDNLFNNKQIKDLKGQAEILPHYYNEGIINIIHGDFNPNNVFNTGDSRNVKVCDFPEMRVDRRNIDLVPIIFNSFLGKFFDDEYKRFFNISERYVTGVKNSENLILDNNKFYIDQLETCLFYLIRIFAVDCKLTTAQIRPFMGDFYSSSTSVDSDVGNSIKHKFLESEFKVPLAKFTYDVLEGNLGDKIKSYPNSRDFKEQCKLINELFTPLGVIIKSENTTLNNGNGSVIKKMRKRYN